MGEVRICHPSREGPRTVGKICAPLQPATVMMRRQLDDDNCANVTLPKFAQCPRTDEEVRDQKSEASERISPLWLLISDF
jgi:hypothetical protein